MKINKQSISFKFYIWLRAWVDILEASLVIVTFTMYKPHLSLKMTSWHIKYYFDKQKNK